MNRFEDLVHTERREQGELSVDRFGELWADSQEELLGDSVEVTDGYRSWWSYIPHFIGSPGYVYAYAYGQLLALSVYERYEQARRGARPELPGDARRRWLEKPGGGRRDRRHRPRRPGLLGRRGSTSSSASSRRPRRPPSSPGASVASAAPGQNAPGAAAPGGRSEQPERGPGVAHQVEQRLRHDPEHDRRRARRAARRRATSSCGAARRAAKPSGSSSSLDPPATAGSPPGPSAAGRGAGGRAGRVAHPHRGDHRQVVGERDHRADHDHDPEPGIAAFDGAWIR